jgi:DNA modification methylase
VAKHIGRLELTWTDKDKALLSTGDGRYDYQFVDPADYRVSEVRLLDEVSRYSQEVPDDAGEQPEPTSDNLLITGDAMHALDSLAKIPEYSDTYLGNVKLCYIDPPFNTGETFTQYEDNITHSIWLTLLRDRLTQIKPLLSPDASIWVHLDDVEVHRCRAVLDEVFGIDRCAAQVVWQKRTTRENRSAFSDNHDHILVYTNGPVTAWRDVRNRLARTDVASNPDNDPRGPWTSVPMSAQGYRPNQMYTITTPTGDVHEPPPNRCWSTVEENYLELLADGRIHFPKGGRGKPRIKQYEADAGGLVPHTIWLASEVGSNDVGKAESIAISEGSPFDTPKPERLLERIVHIATNPGDIVLDCFAGSGTTAAVAHKMGRRWVTIELSPSTSEEYIVPRLQGVVSGTDEVGITVDVSRVADEEVDLPDGVTAEQAQGFYSHVKKFGDSLDLPFDVAQITEKVVRARVKEPESPLNAEESKLLLKLLKKFRTGDPDAGTTDLMSEAVRALRSASKTRDETTVRWFGGGGFTHLRVHESMFVEIDGTVLLADWAVNRALTVAMCAQLGVRHRQEGIFAGRRGRVRYVILDGMATEATVQAICDRLPEGDIVEVWATQVDPAAAEALRGERKGSSLSVIPASVLDQYRRRAAAARPFVSTTEEDQQ